MILADPQSGDIVSTIVTSVTIGLVVGVAAYLRRAGAARRAKQAKKHPPARRAEPVIPIHPLVLPPKSNATVGETATEVVPIQLCRDLLGAPPRRFATELQTYLHADPPQWLAKRSDDPMIEAFRDQGLIRREGKVVWANIVQANSLIFKHGPTDHGAEVVWSDDPYYDTNPGELARIAHELFSLKGTDQLDPEAATFARMLANELIRALRLPVPRRFTGGRVAYQSSVMLTRRHLPYGYVARSLMPVWVHPDPKGGVLLVPAAYWPPSLTSWWKSDPVPVGSRKK